MNVAASHSARVSIDHQTSRPTLRQVVELLGPIVISLVSAPEGPDVLIGEVVIHDPADPQPIERGDLSLAVGVPLGSRALAELLSASAEGEAAGVVVRSPDGSGPTGIQDPPVALLTIPHGTPWGHLYSLVRAAIDSIRQFKPTDAPDGWSLGLGDLYGLVNAIAARAGGATLLDDPEFNVLAYSNLDHPLDDLRRQAVLRRRGPGPTWRRRFEQDGLHRRLREAHDVVRVTGYPRARPRLVMPVRAGDELLGYLWIAQGDEPLGEVAETCLREAAPIVALHLLRERLSGGLEQQLLGRALRGALEGLGSPDLLAAQLGTVADTAFRVVAFGGDPEDRLTSALRQSHVLDQVALQFESFQHPAACVSIDGRIYVLISQSAARNEPRIERICEDILARVAATSSASMWCGIGGFVTHLSEVKRSREESDEVLDVLAAGSSDRGVASIDQLRAPVFLDKLRKMPNLEEELRASPLNLLVEHDLEHGTFYVESLRAFLDAHGDFAAAAAAVCVHPNTIRYRIRRAASIARIDLKDPDERLVASFQLRMLPSRHSPDGASTR